MAYRSSKWSQPMGLTKPCPLLWPRPLQVGHGIIKWFMASVCLSVACLVVTREWKGLENQQGRTPITCVNREPNSKRSQSVKALMLLLAMYAYTLEQTRATLLPVCRSGISNIQSSWQQKKTKSYHGTKIEYNLSNTVTILYVKYFLRTVKISSCYCQKL